MFGKRLCAISRFRRQDAHPSLLAHGRGGRGKRIIRTLKHTLLLVGEEGRVCSQGRFSGKPLRVIFRFKHQDAQPSLLPLWKKGAGGMRGKRRGNAENHIIMQAGVASIASSWLSSPLVAPGAGWKPAHPGNSGRMLQE